MTRNNYYNIKKVIPSRVKRSLKKIHSKGIDFNKERKRIKYDNPTVLTDHFGIRFIQYPWDLTSTDDAISHDFYKPEFMAYDKLLKKNDVVIDLGANVGLHSVYIAKLLKGTGHIYSFEPVPDTYRLMLETLSLNRVDNVSPYMVAMGNKPGKTKMNIFDQKYSAWNTFGKPQFGDHKPTKSIFVETQKLDGFAKQTKINKIDFLKIDVEGFEKQVLQGAALLLKNNKISILSFEVSEIPLKGANSSAREIFKILEDFGYNSYRYNPEKNKFTGPYSDSSEFYENYYASKKNLTLI
ncbi:FkbM family methyltransferase [Candidatus Saccharibacteria bacterium]|nr:FkbM family methyltransferase [Candidatus Saccharibacteria bacterium]